MENLSANMLVSPKTTTYIYLKNKIQEECENGIYNSEKTDLKISKVGIGTKKVGGAIYYDETDPSQGKNFVKEAIQLGINFIDMADINTDGKSEQLIGEVLREVDTERDDIVLATNGAIEVLPDSSRRKNNRPEYLRSALEPSLKRLNQDYVDLSTSREYSRL